jgi:hypothetical protein
MTDMTPDQRTEFDRRRKSGARITALLLLAFCGLVYFITMARIGGQ